MFDLDADDLTLTLEQHRLEFPGLDNKVYFNFGGQGMLPRSGLDAIVDTYQFLQQQGPFSGKVNQWLTHRVELLRHALAHELDCTSQSLTLTENVTVGCNIVLWGMDWQAGDRILLTDCEHPGIVAAVKEIARRFALHYDICPIQATLNQGDPRQVLAAALTPQTRLAILSHVLWNTGQVLPLADLVQLCHRYGDRPIPVLVDAAQSVGCLSLHLDDLQADFYAFTGHKWLCGPAGVGGLYIHPNAVATLDPTFIGWRGITLNDCGEPTGWHTDGRRYEVSTAPYPAYEGLRAAIATHQQWGTSGDRYRQILENSRYLWNCLRRIDGIECLKTTPPEAGLVSFRLTQGLHHGQLINQLEQEGYYLRKLLNPDCIRACVHYFTLPSEIEQLVTAIRQYV
jgi:L-cysteine/cystine lyase